MSPSDATVAMTATTRAAAVQEMAAAFRDAGLETPVLDARWLVLGVLGIEAGELIREPDRRLAAGETARLRAAARRRLDREPVSRILGQRDFHGLAFEIGPDTLDPRPDTETLVETVLELASHWLPDARARAPAIVDLGTGSGAILIALLARLPEATGVGTDISQGALEIAARNAARNGVAERARFALADWRADGWADRLGGVEGPFDIVVSNPPYIPDADIAGLAPEVRRHDPWAALAGGVDGLEAYRQITGGIGRAFATGGIRPLLAPGGIVAFEIGEGQQAAVGELLIQAFGGAAVRLHEARDLGGIVRCVAAQARLRDQRAADDSSD